MAQVVCGAIVILGAWFVIAAAKDLGRRKHEYADSVIEKVCQSMVTNAEGETFQDRRIYSNSPLLRGRIRYVGGVWYWFDDRGHGIGDPAREITEKEAKNVMHSVFWSDTSFIKVRQENYAQFTRLVNAGYSKIVMAILGTGIAITLATNLIH